MDDYEKYYLNSFSHGGTKIWVSNNSVKDWDSGAIASIFVKKNWKYKDKFIQLLNDSCSLWTQYENGYFDWVYELSDEEAKTEYLERTSENECNCHNCKNCVFYPSIDEMKDKINSLEIEHYDYECDKFGLEFIIEELFGVNNV